MAKNYKEAYYKYYGLDKCDFLACKICGAEATQLHHLKYRSQLGSDHPLNLIPLCFKHHYEHHNNNKPTTEELIKANHG